MKNKMIDLNNHLFAALERLNDEELTGQELEQEMKRAKAVSMVANNIVNNARVGLEAMKLQMKNDGDGELPPQFQLKKKDNGNDNN